MPALFLSAILGLRYNLSNTTVSYFFLCLQGKCFKILFVFTASKIMTYWTCRGERTVLLLAGIRQMMLISHVRVQPYGCAKSLFNPVSKVWNGRRIEGTATLDWMERICEHTFLSCAKTRSFDLDLDLDWIILTNEYSCKPMQL